MTTDHKTFDEFISWTMQYVFGGLIEGGTNEMKRRLQTIIAVALNDGASGKWKEKRK